MDDERERDGVWDRSADGWQRWLEWCERLREDRRLAALAVGVVALVAAFGTVGYRALAPSAGPRPEDVLPRVQLAPTSAPPTTVGVVVVHVVGAVAAPGVRQLPAGARVVDALDAAGGPLATAELGQLNLAAPLADGSQIRVPEAGEAVTGPLVVEPVPAGGPAGPRGGPVPLNTASAADLEALPGVGPATAAAIVAWRDANGPFRSVDQLLEVRGIGPAKYEALRELVVVG